MEERVKIITNGSQTQLFIDGVDFSEGCYKIKIEADSTIIRLSIDCNLEAFLQKLEEIKNASVARTTDEKTKE